MLTAEDKKIAKNSFALYIQMLLAMLVGFYTSRVVLDILGVEDFGLYNVVGGVVALFTILNSAMSSSSSRYLTFELGLGNLKRLKQVFGVTLLIHLGIAVLIALLATPLGLWFIKYKMQIEPDRIHAAELVFYISVLTTCTSVVMVPFQSIIIAHERMSIYAYVSVVELLAKLGVVLLLPYLSFDKLIGYALMLLVVHVFMQMFYFFYCRRHFIEARAGLNWEKSLLKEMASFAGWSLFGDSAVLMMTQGINILLNIFFGTAVNAARGIAVQVQGVLSRFVGGFQTALNPQIIKRYATRELKEMHRLIFASSRYSFYVMLILSLPVLLEMDNLLSWWLKEVPDHTTTFLRIMIAISLIECLANPLVFAAKATGRIKRYQAILGGLLLCVVPVSYIFLKMGYPPESVFVVHLIITLMGQVVRVLLVSNMISLSLKEYVMRVILPCFLVASIGYLVPYLAQSLFTNFLLVVFLFFSSLWMLIVAFTLGMKKGEREYIISFFKSRLSF